MSAKQITLKVKDELFEKIKVKREDLNISRHAYLLHIIEHAIEHENDELLISELESEVDELRRTISTTRASLQDKGKEIQEIKDNLYNAKQNQVQLIDEHKTSLDDLNKKNRQLINKLNADTGQLNSIISALNGKVSLWKWSVFGTAGFIFLLIGISLV